ncbi:MAG: hypothetical protein AB7P50_22085 [Alphaproteobacteria bacterium]
MSNKLIALSAGALVLVAAAGSAHALPAAPLKHAATAQLDAQIHAVDYRPLARPFRFMTVPQVRLTLRSAGYHHIRNIHYVRHHVVRGIYHGHPSLAVYRGPAYVATAVAPNGRTYSVAIDPRSHRLVGRSLLW